MKKNNNVEEFWITNITNTNVNLTDLGFTVKPWMTINILDSRHYYFTKEQILKSVESGSLYKRRDKIVVRKTPPILNKPHLVTVDENSITPNKSKSSIVVVEKNYEDLNFPELSIKDDDFAERNAEVALLDHEPSIKIK